MWVWRYAPSLHQKKSPENMATSTKVRESAVIAAPIERVWALIRPMTFSFQSIVASSTMTSGSCADQVGSNHVITYKDGSKWTVRLCELSDLDTFLSYELVSSEDPLPVSGAIHKICLKKVTATSHTYIEWDTEFASDATPEVVQDSKFKKLEAFKELAAALA